MEHKETTRTPYDDMLYLEIACSSPEKEAKCKQILTALKETRTINRTAYLEGYEAAAEQIFEELEEILTEKLEAFNKAHKESESEYWQGRAVTCGETLHLISKLKKKYGVIK